jgi:hypothetical protein
MADPTTELAKEFLEINNYLVRKETKFQKNKKLQGTPSDIDIVAISPKGIREDGFELEENVIGEVKNWRITDKETLDDIYKDKFRFIDVQPKVAWKQLRELIPGRRFDRVIFCLATTEEIHDYAWKKYEIKIITTGFMIKQMTRFFKESERKWTYFPERYNYNAIRSIMYYLYACHRWKDKLTLEDLVWIDPETEPQYRNNFVKTNSKFLENFVYYQSSWEVLGNLISRAAKDGPQWLKNKLKSDKKFWNYIKGKR